MHECSIEREVMKNAGIKRIDTYRDLLNELNITIINDRETIKLLREQNEKLKEQLLSAQPTHSNTPNTLKTLDCIGRQEAVEAMYALVDGCVCDDEYRENPHIDAIVDTLENLPSAHLENDWIPCSERLPEEKQDVLLAFKHNMVVGFWEDILNDGSQTWYANSGNGWMTGTETVDDDGYPLAWMPLPEPWRGEANEID